MNTDYHQARVYLAQASATPHRPFRITLQRWAAQARRRGQPQQPAQRTLFK